MSARQWDSLVIGGGPAGLTAALYLARYRLAVLVVDAGQSRARWISRTHNCPGFPGGISGEELLARLRQQAVDHGVTLETGTVTRVEPVAGGFAADWGSGPVHCRSLLLASGITNRRPPIDPAEHDFALSQGLIRYCPVCDGYEASDQAIGVIGTGAHALAEAVFLRSFSAAVSMIAPDGAHQLTEAERAEARALRIPLIEGPCTQIAPKEAAIAVTAPAGRHLFDCIYPVLGSDSHTELARQAGARLAPDGTLQVDRHQRTSVPGLYAAGDVVLGLDQISHAIGEAGVAATAIRNDLAQQAPLLREAQTGADRPHRPVA